MKIGLNIKVDVTKLDKSRFFKGANGTYADLTVFFDPDSTDKFGNHGSVTQAATKEERQARVKLPFVGNAKVFYREDGEQVKPAAKNDPVQPDFDDDIPF